MTKCRRQCGFSLTEMLVAVAILLVLMGALLAFGRHLRRQGQEKLCRSTIGVLVAAIEQYHDFHGAFPAMLPPPPPVGPVPNAAVWRQRNENLYQQLYSLPQARALCDQISKSLIGDTDGDGVMEFLDPWGMPLDYQNMPGQTFPLVVSAGPDKQPNTGDDISSK